MSRQWIKLWTTMPYDADYRRLSPEAKTTWIHCLLLADDDGHLQTKLGPLPLEEVAIGLSSERIHAALDQLVAAKFLVLQTTGVYSIRNWRKYQGGHVASGPAAPPLPDHFEPQVCAFLHIVAQQNKTKKLTPVRDATLRQELANLHAQFGEKAFSYGLSATIKRGIPDTRYVKKVSANFVANDGLKTKAVPAKADTPPLAPSPPPPPLFPGILLPSTVINSQDSKKPRYYREFRDEDKRGVR